MALFASFWCSWAFASNHGYRKKGSKIGASDYVPDLQEKTHSEVTTCASGARQIRKVTVRLVTLTGAVCYFRNQMRLGAKIFLTSALLITILAAVAGWSLLAVRRLVEVNRGILTQTLPAISLAASLRESLPTLVRLESRYIVLGDPEYFSLWVKRAQQVAAEVDRLAGLVESDEERASLAEVRAQIAAYRRLVDRERALMTRGEKNAAIQLSERQSRPAADQAESAAVLLGAAIESAAERALAGARELERRTWTGVLLALVVSAGAALGGTAWVAVRLTRSLRRLSAATGEIAEGSFRDPVRVETRDEIGDLARSFNLMATRLREAEAMKEEFFSSISHDLRTPLTSIHEATHLLDERVPGALTPKQERLVTIIGVSAERLLRLINQILDLSRLRAGLLPLERRRVDLDRLAGRALDELRPQAEERGVELRRSAAAGAVKVFGDEDRLLQVLVNLVGNAVKFTPAGGSVTLALEDRGEEIEVTVADTGVGIPAEALPLIFDRYQQAHRDRGGSGLGLAIVKALVESHGGRVRAESEEGRGSRFTVVLPREGGSS
jgi:signal transduction histidine kinase